MLQVAKGLDGYLLDFELFEADRARGGPSWVRQLRKAAITRFAELGFPTPRHKDPALREEWKYTDVAPMAEIRFKPAPPEVGGGRWEVGVWGLGVAGAQLVFMNGHYVHERSSLRSIPEGVKVGSLAVALNAHPALVEPHLARYAGYQDHPFVALNTAFIEDGAFIYIPPGKILEEPIHLLFVSTASREPFVSHPRNLIIVGRNSQVTIVESYVGLEQDVYFTNGVTEIVAHENAVIDHYKLELESGAAFHMATLQSHLDRSSNFTTCSIDLGGALVRNDLNVVLDGEGSECTLNGLYMVTGRQHVDNHTRIDHRKPHCTSRELYKGILDGQSRGVFNGKIYVHKFAPKTDAYQLNKNLLLSDDAVIDTKPQLEIYNNDVKCSHGSTIGQLDRDSLFYLRSRGMDLEAAQSLLTYAFASEIISRIKVEPIRAWLEDLVVTRFQKDSHPPACALHADREDTP